MILSELVGPEDDPEVRIYGMEFELHALTKQMAAECRTDSEAFTEHLGALAIHHRKLEHGEHILGLGITCPCLPVIALSAVPHLETAPLPDASDVRPSPPARDAVTLGYDEASRVPEGQHVAREVFTADGIPFVRCSCSTAKSPTSHRWLSEHVPNGGVAELQAVVKRQAEGAKA